PPGGKKRGGANPNPNPNPSSKPNPSPNPNPSSKPNPNPNPSSHCHPNTSSKSSVLDPIHICPDSWFLTAPSPTLRPALLLFSMPCLLNPSSSTPTLPLHSALSWLCALPFRDLLGAPPNLFCPAPARAGTVGAALLLARLPELPPSVCLLTLATHPSISSITDSVLHHL
ncbi:H1', partial [Human betaherpesvirus 7]